MKFIYDNKYLACAKCSVSDKVYNVNLVQYDDDNYNYDWNIFKQDSESFIIFFEKPEVNTILINGTDIRMDACNGIDEDRQIIGYLNSKQNFKIEFRKENTCVIYAIDDKNCNYFVKVNNDHFVLTKNKNDATIFIFE